VRTTIVAWSAVSGLVLGLMGGILLFAALVVGGELLPSIVPRLGGRARIVAVLFSFVLLPLVGAALGWMEGRLKLR
jgi:hypothetical protein